jgi:hypothetical protein
VGLPLDIEPDTKRRRLDAPPTAAPGWGLATVIVQLAMTDAEKQSDLVRAACC